MAYYYHYFEIKLIFGKLQYMERELTKLYYTISEVADMFDVNQSLLRYWQSEFPRLKPKTNKKGDRKYTKSDIEYIDKIYTLVKIKGYTLEGARKEMNRKENINSRHDALLNRLNAIREGLDALENDLG